MAAKTRNSEVEVDSSSEEDCKQRPYVVKFLKAIENAKNVKKVAIFSHAFPDPDAIGAMMGMEWLLSKYDIECTCFFDGKISHPQNLALVNLLDPNLRPVEEYDPKNFGFHVLVDTVPSHAGVGSNKIDFDLVVDHHKEIPNGGFNGLFINLKAGSACATVYDILENLNFHLEEDNDHDARVATALLVGIATDTDHLMSDDTTQYEFLAWSKLFNFKTPALKQIVNYRRPKFWIKKQAEVVSNATQLDGICVVFLGIVPAEHRDVISDTSDKIITWEDTSVAIAFAIINGERIEGSVRSNNASVSVPSLCKQLGGKHGSGGGKLGKGAYSYPLAGGELDDEDEETTKDKAYEFYKEKETKRVFRIISK